MNCTVIMIMCCHIDHVMVASLGEVLCITRFGVPKMKENALISELLPVSLNVTRIT